MIDLGGTPAVRRAGAAIALCVSALFLVGCNADSFIDPSVVGRWEKTPTVMPILDRLTAIEDEPTEFVQSSPPMPSDLVPELDQYRLAPGDQVEVKIRDFYTIGAEETFLLQVDMRGEIVVPRLPPIRAQGRTSAELIEAISNAIRDAKIQDRPVVAVSNQTKRKQTYSVMGAVQTPGVFIVPEANFRLLEALTSAGALNETIPYIYVVRQVPLSDQASGKLPDSEPVRRTKPNVPPLDAPGNPPPGTPAGEAPKKGEDLIDLIDSLSKKPKEEPKSPGVFGSEPTAAPVRSAHFDPPPINLPEGDRSSGASTNGWVFIGGKWVKSKSSAEGGTSGGGEQNLVTQRIIQIPTGPLLAGAADVNIVIRPGDVIRAPVPKGGLVYMAGEVNRPGVYSIPTDAKLTLLRAIDAAGGLHSIAIPERVDLMRMVGNDRQATIMLDVRAIGEQTQPDIYLKPDDRINVGTNFWAFPLAIIRNGFRFTYGFGFILDRNFQGDVFGVDNSVVR